MASFTLSWVSDKPEVSLSFESCLSSLPAAFALSNAAVWSPRDKVIIDSSTRVKTFFSISLIFSSSRASSGSSSRDSVFGISELFDFL